MRSRFRKRKAQPEAVIEALVAAFGKLGLTDQAHKLRLFVAWKDMVGERVAARTEPHTLSRGVLTIRTHSAAWQNELTYLKAELIMKINAGLGRKTIKDLKFIAGHKSAPEKRAAPQLPEATEEERARTAAAAAVIDDPEIRESFAALMEKGQRAKRSG